MDDTCWSRFAPKAEIEASFSGPKFGTISVAGKSRSMEDTVAVKLNLCYPEIKGMDSIHFFAVFDGHGGSRVSTLCREKMHLFVKEELMLVDRLSQVDAISLTGKIGIKSLLGEWEIALKKAFVRMDKEAVSLCSSVGSRSEDGYHLVDVAFGGSTAVVAILTQEWIIIATCGDSRAVVSRGGQAYSLTEDHKPDRPDELARIEAAGGSVIKLNGPRVAGILAMSRAIGDSYLKPFVIPDPDVTFLKRQAEDECLILASDGLWDVVSPNVACDVCRVCLDEPGTPSSDLQFKSNTRGKECKSEPPSPGTMAAALRLALARNSLDNIRSEAQLPTSCLTSPSDKPFPLCSVFSVN